MLIQNGFALRYERLPYTFRVGRWCTLQITRVVDGLEASVMAIDAPSACGVAVTP